ncbi:hypothetical protein OHR68_19575 [Spirillospora sp. NBC_00431]
MSRAGKITMLMAAVMSMAGISLSAVPASAGAQAKPSPPSGHQQAAKRHCVVNLSNRGKTTCYDGFRKAITAASGGRITNAPDNPAAAMADPGFIARINALPAAKKRTGFSEIVLSIEYEHPTMVASVWSP